MHCAMGGKSKAKVWLHNAFVLLSPVLLFVSLSLVSSFLIPKVMNSLDTLDDDALCLVLGQLSLTECLQQRLVSLRVDALVHRVCQSRRSLALFANEKMAQLYSDAFSIEIQNDSLFLEQLSEDVRQHLGTYFPNVENLITFQSSLPLILGILDFWPNLTSLCLTHSPSIPWDRLEALFSLKRLTLFGLPTGSGVEIATKAARPVLCRLQSFSLIGYYPALIPVLGCLSSSCTELLLEHVRVAPWEWPQLKKVNGQLLSSVTRLTLGRVGQSYCSFVDDTANNLAKMSEFVCRHFGNLEALEVRYTLQNPSVLRHLLAELTHLKRLTELRLALADWRQLPELAVQSEMTPLRSVTLLTLDLDLPSSEERDLFSQGEIKARLRGLFPNVPDGSLCVTVGAFKAEALTTLGECVRNEVEMKNLAVL